jgi:hypothetical protein
MIFMAVLTFSGSSDDLIGVVLTPDAGGSLTVVDRRDDERVTRLDEEFNVRDGYTEFVVNVDGKDEFAAFGRYGAAAWGFGVSQADEDLPLPSSYIFTIGQAEFCDYSAVLTVTFVGKDVVVRELGETY